MKHLILAFVALAFVQSAFAGPFRNRGNGNSQPQAQQPRAAQHQPQEQPAVAVPKPVGERPPAPVVPEAVGESTAAAEAVSSRPLKLDMSKPDLSKLDLTGLRSASIGKLDTLRVSKFHGNYPASDADFLKKNQETPKYPYESELGPNPQKVELTAAEFLLLEQTNKVRKGLGLRLLHPSQKLMDMIRKKAWNMAAYNNFDHGQSPTPGTLGGRSKNINGVVWTMGARENIGWNYGSVDSAMTGWINSGGHYASIVSDTDEFGGSVAIGPNGNPYWAQVFHIAEPKK